jgi:hypothetical protein
MDAILGILQLLVALWFCYMTATQAKKKGYNGFLWFFAGSIIGLIVMARLPDTTADNLSPEFIAQKKKTANQIAIGFIVVGVVLGWILLANS